MIVAASTQRAIGFVIAAFVVIGFVLFIWFNIREAKAELGSEIELAPNRKPYLNDEELESTKLNRTLLLSLGLLSAIAVGLPLYWLAEPGRQENAQSGVLRKEATRGKALFDQFCAACHNPGGVGGVAPYTLTDETTGKFVAQVSWNAPALTSVMTRFDETEVRYILNYGRNVMPAWGTIGGGPMTDQQITELIVYLRTIQKIGDQGQKDVQAAVMDGVLQQAIADAKKEDRGLLAEQAAIDVDQASADKLSTTIYTTFDATKKADLQTTLDNINKRITAAKAKLEADAKVIGQQRVDIMVKAPEGSIEQRKYGEYLFNNPAASLSYGCARCHTKGASYKYVDTQGHNLFPNGPVAGGGWFGPNLTGGSETRQFETSKTQQDFIAVGSKIGVKYGEYGQGSGKMPGFGARTEDNCKIPPPPGTGGPPVADCKYPAILTPEQIAAIVAYERSL